MKTSDEKSTGSPEKSLEKSLKSQKLLKPQPTVPPPVDLPAEKEIGGPTGLEPTRYGDWERNGRVSDF